jgi:putative nucleotidyltransferase with HDIG domain
MSVKAATPRDGQAGAHPESSVAALITLVASAASVTLALTAVDAVHAIGRHPAAAASFLAVTIALQLATVQVYGRGAMSFSGAGLLAVGFSFGPGTAIFVAITTAVVNLLRRRGKLHRAIFDAAQLALASAAGAFLWEVTRAAHLPALVRFGPAAGAATVFLAVNVGLLSTAMGLSEGIPPIEIWRERFRWMTPYYVASGPLALACVLAYDRLGPVGLVAFALPPASMMFSVRQYLSRTQEVVEELRSANAELEARNAEIRRRHLETIAALARSMEAKDYYTGGHTERVSDVAVAIARELGMDDDELEAVEVGALLHDIGKIGIPERILHKPGPLDDEEWKVMKEHPVISEFILSGIDLHPYVTQIARSSHERLDGEGYPDGLAGEQIPLPARIVLVADAVDALTSDRPYRRARPVQAALEEIRAHTGTQFCPRVVDALERVHAEHPHLFGAALRAVDAA